MDVTSGEILRWLAQHYILSTTHAQFETSLLDIAENAEECLITAETMQLTDHTASSNP